MTLALVAVAAFAALGFQQWLHSRALTERDGFHARERRELYIRIQSPELAPVIAHAAEVLIDPTANQRVKFDDDNDFHEKTQEG